MSKSTMNAGNLVASPESLAQAIEATHEAIDANVEMVSYSYYLPFDRYAKKGKNPKTVYQAIAHAMGITTADGEGIGKAPAVCQRTATLAALHLTRACKVTKGGSIAPNPSQWLEQAFKDIVGSSAFSYHTKPTKSRKYATLAVESEGITPRGRAFFEASTGKNTEEPVATWEGSAPAVAAIVKGFRDGGKHTITIIDRDDAEVVRHTFTLNFKHQVEGSNLKR